jgi:hypothetical protein
VGLRELPVFRPEVERKAVAVCVSIPSVKLCETDRCVSSARLNVLRQSSSVKGYVFPSCHQPAVTLLARAAIYHEMRNDQAVGAGLVLRNSLLLFANRPS